MSRPGQPHPHQDCVMLADGWAGVTWFCHAGRLHTEVLPLFALVPYAPPAAEGQESPE